MKLKVVSNPALQELSTLIQGQVQRWSTCRNHPYFHSLIDPTISIHHIVFNYVRTIPLVFENTDTKAPVDPIIIPFYVMGIDYTLSSKEPIFSCPCPGNAKTMSTTSLERQNIYLFGIRLGDLLTLLLERAVSHGHILVNERTHLAIRNFVQTWRSSRYIYKVQDGNSKTAYGSVANHLGFYSASDRKVLLFHLTPNSPQLHQPQRLKSMSRQTLASHMLYVNPSDFSTIIEVNPSNASVNASMPFLTRYLNHVFAQSTDTSLAHTLCNYVVFQNPILNDSAQANLHMSTHPNKVESKDDAKHTIYYYDLEPRPLLEVLLELAPRHPDLLRLIPKWKRYVIQKDAMEYIDVPSLSQLHKQIPVQDLGRVRVSSFRTFTDHLLLQSWFRHRPAVSKRHGVSYSGGHRTISSTKSRINEDPEEIQSRSQSTTQTTHEDSDGDDCISEATNSIVTEKDNLNSMEIVHFESLIDIHDPTEFPPLKKKDVRINIQSDEQLGAQSDTHPTTQQRNLALEDKNMCIIA